MEFKNETQKRNFKLNTKYFSIRYTISYVIILFTLYSFPNSLLRIFILNKLFGKTYEVG